MMLGNIVSIVDSIVKLKLTININDTDNIINYNVVFVDGNIKIVGEILSIDDGYARVLLIGEIIDGLFITGFIRKPSFKSTCRLIEKDELELLLGGYYE